MKVFNSNRTEFSIVNTEMHIVDNKAIELDDQKRVSSSLKMEFNLYMGLTYIQVFTVLISQSVS